MIESLRFGARSTADQVLAGIDLTGRRIVVTGCNSGLGLQTLQALAANGAQVIGLARTWAAARAACAAASRFCIPVECDLSDLASVTAAAGAIRALDGALDAIVANAAVAFLPVLQTRYGVEMQFLVNHIGHFALVNALADRVHDATGRIVFVGGQECVRPPTAEARAFDDLGSARSYDPRTAFERSKWALALYARELSRRLGARRVGVNVAIAAPTAGTALNRHRQRSLWSRAMAALRGTSVQRAAATQTLLAANPALGARSGEVWTACRMTQVHPLLDDAATATRLWDVSAELVARHATAAVGARPAADVAVAAAA